MRAFIAVLAITCCFCGCHHHKHTHKKVTHHTEEHHHYPETDLSNKNFTIEQDIDLHLDEMPQNYQ